MILKRIILSLNLMLFISFYTSAQTLLDNNLYTQNWFGLHPAFAGHNENLELVLQAKSKQMSAGSNYTASMLSVNGRVQDRIGLGGQIITNNQGGFESITVSGTSAYTTPIAENHSLSFGISLGLTQNSINFNSIDLNQFVDIDDPLIGSGDFQESFIRIGTGFLYEFKGFKLAFTAPSIFQQNNTLREVITASASYAIESDNVVIEPSILVRSYDINPTEVTGLVYAEIQEKFWTQFGYRNNNSFLLGAGLKFNEINVGYAYGLPMSDQENITNNSHEVVVGIRFGKKQ